jgi:hypothetical protein
MAEALGVLTMEPLAASRRVNPLRHSPELRNHSLACRIHRRDHGERREQNERYGS